MADISKITLPSGSTYDIKDAALTAVVGKRALATGESSHDTRITAVETAVGDLNSHDTTQDTRLSTVEAAIEGLIAGGLTYKIVTTLPTASSETTGNIYLVLHTHTSGSSDSSKKDYYDEYMTIKTGATTYVWEKIGNTDIDLSGYVAKGTYSGTAANGTTGITISDHNVIQGTTSSTVYYTKSGVLGTGTTFTNSTSNVSFSGMSKESVLTSATTATVPKPSYTTRYLTATASGTALNAPTSNAITSLGAASTAKFVKSYPGSKKYLATTTIIGVGSNTTTASKATAGTAVSVAKAGTEITVGSGDSTASTTNTDFLKSISVSNETLTIGAAKLSTTKVIPAVSNGTITPYSFTDVTVPIKNASASTFATGGLTDNTTMYSVGDEVLVDLGTPTTGDGVTGYNPSTSKFVTSASVSTNPSITLSEGTTTSTGAIKYIKEAGTSGTNAVTFSTGTTVQAITDVGTATAAAQTITVGTNDKVDAVIALSGATSTGASSATISGTNSGIGVSSHYVNDNGHTHTTSTTF